MCSDGTLTIDGGVLQMNTHERVTFDPVSWQVGRQGVVNLINPGWSPRLDPGPGPGGGVRGWNLMLVGISICHPETIGDGSVTDGSASRESTRLSTTNCECFPQREHFLLLGLPPRT